MTSEPRNPDHQPSPLLRQSGPTLRVGEPPTIQPSPFPPSPQPPPPLPHPASAYWVWLTIPTAILLLASIMTTGSDRQVSLPGLGVLPETCTLHSRFGIDCPGCGLTRTFIHLAHGNLDAAWTLNPVGSLLFVFVLAQIPLAIGSLSKNRSFRAVQRIMERVTPWNQILLIGLLVALLVQWIVRLGFV